MRRRQVLGGITSVLAGAAVAGRAGSQDRFQPLGMASVGGAKEVVVDDGGDTAFLATTDGFATLDLTDPSDPAVLAERRDLLSERDGGPMELIWDVKADGDRLVVAGPANPSGDISGFVLYDVSDPAEPERVAFHETSFPIHNAFLADDVVYLTAGGPIVLVDVSDDDPRQVGRWSIEDADGRWSEVPRFLRPPHDVWVQGGLAYVACWDAGTWIVDVSDPTAPRSVNRVGGLAREDLAELSAGEASREATEPPGNHHYVRTSEDGSLLAVGKESWSTEPGSGGPSGIDLWDVSDQESPDDLATIPPPRASDETRGGTWTTSHNFDIVGGRLYSSWYQGGVKIHDVSDPRSPEELAWWRRPEEAAFWSAVLATEDFFVASSTDYPAPAATEGLYTFPNRAGDQPDPPPLTDRSVETTRSTETASGAVDTITSTAPTTTGSTATMDRNTGGVSSTASDRETTAGPPATETSGQSGFGVWAAIAGVGGAAWLTRRDDESSRTRDGD